MKNKLNDKQSEWYKYYTEIFKIIEKQILYLYLSNKRYNKV